MIRKGKTFQMPPGWATVPQQTSEGRDRKCGFGSAQEPAEGKVPAKLSPMPDSRQEYRVAVDVGGTFTDLVLVDSRSGTTHLDKVPSTPGRADAVLAGLRRIVARGGISPRDVSLLVHGFTIGTNALLTRSGARVAMAVSAGTRDVLEIGDQRRPHLYRLSQEKPTPVVPRSRIAEVRERRDAFGRIVTPLTSEETERVTGLLAALAPEAVAVCLGYSFLDSDAENMLEEAIRAVLPDVPVFLSSRVNPQIEEYPRANTTAIAAYVGPVVGRYVATLDQALAREGVGAPLRLMRSDGGVATPHSAQENPAAMILSGPAGGVIAGGAVAAELEVGDLVTFDMGGTSADFSVITGGEPRVVTEREVNGQPLRLPTLDIETISAGGGSIAHVDLGGALRVGPGSAGAEPGPACYGKGGDQATVTDAALVLGILDEHEFLGGDFPLDEELAREAVRRNVAAPLGLGLAEAAMGVVRVAIAGMNQAIRKLSVERGLDIREFALLAFGGAGPIYAPFMARDLDMREVFVPAYPGVYAAQGLLMTDIRHTTQKAFQRRFATVGETELTGEFESLAARLDQALARDGIDPPDRRFRFLADMRCSGQFHELLVPLSDPREPGWWKIGEICATFHAVHDRAYGHSDPSAEVEFVNLRAEGLGMIARPAPPDAAVRSFGTPEPATTRPVCFDAGEGYGETAIYRRDALTPGQSLAGPAIITQRDTTIVVLAGQTASVTNNGILRIREVDAL